VARSPPEPGGILESDGFDLALAGDRRIDGVEKAELLPKPAEEPHNPQAIRPVGVLDHVTETEHAKRPAGPIDDLRIGVADPDDLAMAALRVEDAGEESLAPLRPRATGPLDQLRDRGDVRARRGSDLAHGPSAQRWEHGLLCLDADRLL
jgi:hypothetical protein